jgi:hypothetical protein
MPLIPKGGISRNLMRMLASNHILTVRHHSPLVQFLGFVQAIKNAEEMNKDILPDTKFNLVHQIYNEHAE